MNTSKDKYRSEIIFNE